MTAVVAVVFTSLGAAAANAAVTAGADPTLESSWTPIVAATDPVSRSFDLDAALESGADPALASDWAEGYAAGGGVVIDSSGTIRSNPTLSAQIEAFSACTGRNQFWTDIWGYHWELDQCQGTYLKNSIAAGTGVATAIAGIAAATGVGIPAAAVAAAAGIIGIVAVPSLESCLVRGTGITVHWTVGTWWCGSQT
jgi:hypothetical protein